MDHSKQAATLEHELDVTGEDLLRPLVRGEVTKSATGNPNSGVSIGALVALRDGGRIPLVVLDSAPDAAIPARSVVDLHGGHIGKKVVVMFESADAGRPIIMGIIRDAPGWPLSDRPATVEVDSDGESMIVSAKNRLVLQCGSASLTLSADGRVMIRGKSVVSHAEQVNRIRGGSVQIN